jgi:acyl-lipid omega-6 desaturase (Delta-12 desaturase)
MTTPEPDDLKARDVRANMPADRRTRCYLASVPLFAACAIAYAGTFCLACCSAHPVFAAAAAVVNGLVIGLLFIIGHDACHGSFTPAAFLNRLLARLAFFTSLQPYTSWVYTHNGLHHGWTNLKGKDVVFAPLTLAEYRALPRHRRLLERACRSPLGIGLMHLTQVWWRHEIWPAAANAPKDLRQFRRDRLMVLAFLLAKASLAFGLCLGTSGSAGWAALKVAGLLTLIYAVWFWLIGFVTFQQHTNPEVPWYDDAAEWSFYRGQIHGTPHVSFPLWFHKLLFNVMDHNAHHVDPLVPSYRLPESQRSLENDYGHDVVESIWSVRTFLRSLRVCRLYDYVRHQWLDYDGSPTSRPGLNRLAGEALQAESYRQAA